MEVIASCAAPLSPHPPPRCKRTSLSYCPWRMHDVDDRRGGDVTTSFGTCKLVDSKGPHEFRAFVKRFWRLYGRDALSLYGGAAKDVEHLKLRMKAHLRKWNDLGVEAYEKLRMVAIRVHDMGGLVADGKQHDENVGIEETWIQANLRECEGVKAINRLRGGAGSYPADDESIILYVVYSPEPPSTAKPRCLMKQAMLKGIHVPNGTALDPWDLEELRCVERHGSAPRPYANAPVWAACVEELAGLGYERTACARAESLGAFDATLGSNLAHWWILHRFMRAKRCTRSSPSRTTRCRCTISAARRGWTPRSWCFASTSRATARASGACARSACRPCSARPGARGRRARVTTATTSSWAPPARRSRSRRRRR